MSEVNTNTITKSNLSLEVGKYYQNLKGFVVKITHHSECFDFFLDENGCIYKKDGTVSRESFEPYSKKTLVHEVEIKVINNNNTEDQVAKENAVDTRTPVSIEVGKYYRDREGTVYLISDFDKDAPNGWQYKSRNYSWIKSGWYFEEGDPYERDLVEEVS